jgi:hypothetical protein
MTCGGDSDKKVYVLQLSGATAGRFPTETVPSQRLEKSSACLICLIRRNFTASKLAWIKEYEPRLFERIHKIMLPESYVAMRMTGDM